MTTLSPPFSESIASAGVLLAGAVLLLAGLAKMLDPRHFARHLRRLLGLSRKAGYGLALVLIPAQSALGVALIVHLWPSRLLSAIAILMFGLAVLTFWGIRSSRIEECGCYNGLIALSPKQSLGLDVLCGVLLLLAEAQVVRSRPAPWKLFLLTTVAVGSGLVACALVRHFQRHRRPLLDLSPIKVGHRWHPRWQSARSAVMHEGEKLVVFLSPDCSLCRRWIKVLNLVHRTADLPTVIAIVGAPDVDEFMANHSIRFPVLATKPWTMARLVRGESPVAVVMKDGIVQEKHIRSLPAWIHERLRRGLSHAAGALR